MWLWWDVRRAPSERRLSTAGAHSGLAAIVGVALTAPLFAGWRTVTAIANLASRQGWASGARLVARGAESVGSTLGGSGTGSALRTAAYAAFLALFVLGLLRLLRRTATSATPAEVWGVSLLLFALAAPYLLPWYAAWFVTFLALMSDEGLARIGLAATALMALSGIPAEPAPDPALWRGMILAVHYTLAPVMLGLFALAARRVLRRS